MHDRRHRDHTHDPVDVIQRPLPGVLFSSIALAVPAQVGDDDAESIGQSACERVVRSRRESASVEQHYHRCGCLAPIPVVQSRAAVNCDSLVQRFNGRSFDAGSRIHGS